MDSIQTGNILSGCGVLVYSCLHAIGSVLGILLIGLLIILGLISDLLFGDP